ncbi:GNAT family N-acetyltransferase [Formosa sp. A9]|uniref:GNAT family N-acetyltransferase n=1 Tax=Formosa sp. A9 TaxID=3442641 RepID=UPI003EBF9CCE
MELLFKTITHADLQLVLDMFKAAAEKIAEKNIDHWQYWKNPPQEKIQWVEAGLKNGEFVFIYTNKGQKIGMVRILNEDVLYWGVQEQKAKYVHSLAIQEAFNGKGFGKKVLQAIAEEAKQARCMFLRLDADSKNPKLCKYYEDMGFVKVGEKQLPLSVYNLYQKSLN